MLNYRFSTREKVLLAVFVVIVVLLVWLEFFFLPTQNRLDSLDQQIAATSDQMVTDSAKAAQMKKMQNAIDGYQQQGRKLKTIPQYNNESALIALIDKAMGSSTVYNMTFTVTDSSSTSTSAAAGSAASVPGVDSAHLVKRTMKLSFGCNSYSEAYAVVSAICDGDYPCTIDSFTFADNERQRQLSSSSSSRTAASGSSTGQSNPYSVTIQVTFYEKK